MNEHTPTVKEGLVNITDLSKFYVSENRNGRPSVGTLGNEEYVAFGYGEGTAGRCCCILNSSYVGVVCNK